MLRRNLRNGDVLGRMGGEEFAIFLPGSTLAQAKAIGNRLTKPMPFTTPAGIPLTVTLSIGAVIAMPEATLDQMLVAADKALYQAKENGRAQLVVWDEITAPVAMGV
jgi:diguanylate cyclase (GGDEF)-like protein